MRTQAVSHAKQLVYTKHSGVMSTLSYNLRGYPFGSVTPYMCDEQGKLYFFISDIAQHTKNLVHDKRMSITIFDAAQSGDQNEHGRVTIVGDGSLVPVERADDLLNKYIALHPEADSYRSTHDFNLWQLDPVRIRYIGGFGKIFWIEKGEWLATEKAWDNKQEQHMINHMNEDHQDAMALILNQHYHVEDTAPVMNGLLPQGCYIRSHNKNYYIPFNEVCDSPQAVRKALVQLTKDARATV